MRHISIPNYIKIGCEDIKIFQDGGRQPSLICLGHIWTTNSEYLGLSITVQNLVMIVAVVFIIQEAFEKRWAHSPLRAAARAVTRLSNTRRHRVIKRHRREWPQARVVAPRWEHRRRDNCNITV